MTGLKAEGVACCRPVAEIRDGTHQHHISHRTRPSRSLSIHYRQDHHRTGGRPRPLPEGLILPEAEALIAATGADFRIGGDRAFYAPGQDYVQVPRPDAYFDPINWHRTAFHELSHWVGGRNRLDRDQTGAFGSKEYGREELVAEMAGAFVCAALGIVPTVRHADYLGSWLDIIREDNRAIVRAASAASKAANFLLDFRGEVTADQPDTGDPAAWREAA